MEKQLAGADYRIFNLEAPKTSGDPKNNNTENWTHP